ncbi:hypothetical protein CJ030_MR8G028818 [Morella rubra]|uniref:GRF-type domain-containing protein n=1 Tax=Morella rubra TaxID=262757 RepID=A0A6A1US89_9ROSI|nr:hypothetical protein CJ030_MR8G028818 [Morella rubra]
MSSVSWSSSRQSGGSQCGSVGKCSGSQDADFVSCRCNIWATVRTSLKDDNLGRQFYGYPMYSDTSTGCNFFRWIDPPICPCGQEFLPPMMRKMKKLEEEARKLKEKEKRMKMCLFGS